MRRWDSARLPTQARSSGEKTDGKYLAMVSTYRPEVRQQIPRAQLNLIWTQPREVDGRNAHCRRMPTHRHSLVFLRHRLSTGDCIVCGCLRSSVLVACSNVRQDYLTLVKRKLACPVRLVIFLLD